MLVAGSVEAPTDGFAETRSLVTMAGGSEAAMRAALARLPPVAVAPRAGVRLPVDARVTVLDVDPVHHEVSSSGVRAGRLEWRAGGAGP